MVPPSLCCCLYLCRNFQNSGPHMDVAQIFFWKDWIGSSMWFLRFKLLRKPKLKKIRFGPLVLAVRTQPKTFPEDTACSERLSSGTSLGSRGWGVACQDEDCETFPKLQVKMGEMFGGNITVFCFPACFEDRSEFLSLIQEQVVLTSSFPWLQRAAVIWIVGRRCTTEGPSTSSTSIACLCLTACSHSFWIFRRQFLLLAWLKWRLWLRASLTLWLKAL